MPDGDDPHYVAFGSVEERVWCDDHLPVWKLGEFRYDSSGIREFFEPSQYRFSPLTETNCSLRIIPANVTES